MDELWLFLCPCFPDLAAGIKFPAPDRNAVTMEEATVQVWRGEFFMIEGADEKGTGIHLRTGDSVCWGNGTCMLFLRLLPRDIHLEGNAELVLYDPVQGAPIRLLQGQDDLSAVRQSGEDFSRPCLVLRMDGNLDRVARLIRHARVRIGEHEIRVADFQLRMHHAAFHVIRQRMIRILRHISERHDAHHLPAQRFLVKMDGFPRIAVKNQIWIQTD